MNSKRNHEPNNEINQPHFWANLAEENDGDEDYYDPYEENDGDEDYYDFYEEDLPPYPAGEAYQAYCEDPTYDNAIEAAEEIWGIPDPRLIGLD
ncbi:hypothetical protein AB3M80_04750 [Arthrospira platensis BEA 1257B]